MRDYSYHTVSSIIHAFEKSVNFHFEVCNDQSYTHVHHATDLNMIFT